MAAYLKKLFRHNPLVARKPLIRVTEQLLAVAAADGRALRGRIWLGRGTLFMPGWETKRAVGPPTTGRSAWDRMKVRVKSSHKAMRCRGIQKRCSRIVEKYILFQEFTANCLQSGKVNLAGQAAACLCMSSPRSRLSFSN